MISPKYVASKFLYSEINVGPAIRPQPEPMPVQESNAAKKLRQLKEQLKRRERPLDPIKKQIERIERSEYRSQQTVKVSEIKPPDVIMYPIPRIINQGPSTGLTPEEIKDKWKWKKNKPTSPEDKKSPEVSEPKDSPENSQNIKNKNMMFIIEKNLGQVNKKKIDLEIKKNRSLEQQQKEIEDNPNAKPVKQVDTSKFFRDQMNLLRKERDWSKKKVDVHRQEQQEIKRLKREGKTESITARIDEIAKEIQNQDPSKKCICCHKEIDDNGSSVEMSFTWGSSHDGDLMKGFICDSCEEMAQKYIDKTIGDDQPKYCLCCKKKIKVDRELLGDGKVQSNLEGGVVRISIKDVWPYRICDPCADEAEKYCKIEDWMSPEMNYDTTGHVTKKELTQLLKKRNITSRLDKVAEELEQAGRPDIALALDKVSDQLEKQATVQDFLNKIKDMFKKEEIYNLPEQAKKKVIEEVQKILVPGKGWVPSRNIQGQLPMTKVMGLNREVQILKQFIRLKP